MAEPGPLHREGSLADELAGLLDEAGHPAEELATITFGELDSLLVAELVLVAEDHLGRRLAVEAFELDTPVRDLLSIADPA